MECNNYLFPGNDYDTPENLPHAFMDNLLLRSRWYFYWKNFGIFVRTGKCGRAGKLDAFNQTEYSNGNMRLVESIGGKVHLRGLNNIDKLNGEAAVIVANHMSLLETALLHSVMRPRIDFTFVIKRSLFDVKYFGDIMRSLEAIAVDRINPRDDFKAVLTEGKERLARGKSIVLFPQATRNEVFIPENFNTIGIKLAKSAGVKVLPLALKTDFLGNGKLLRDMGPVHRDHQVYFEFGEPLEITDSGKTQHEAIIEFITDRLDKWYQAENRTRPLPQA
ncbi:MAG: 1-acyl-sn-glycerol-3-phosphate acyltransferase [Lentisphaerae bacterium]|nr:1-acyl-sn-glycerol-3-phosphate acyltransferase [Lentisphaerota bacterium]